MTDKKENKEGKEDDSLPQLGYWKIRGLAHPIRTMLAYTNTKYKNVMYEQGDDFSRDAWDSVKHKQGLDFPNLPYWIEPSTGLKITQSQAITMHIARQNNLVGSTNTEKAHLDMLIGVLLDIRPAWTSCCYNPKFKELVGDVLGKKIAGTVGELDAWMAKRKWFIGDNLSVADFLFFEFFDQISTYDAKYLEKYSNLATWSKNFAALDAIASYRKSSAFFAHPINNKHAAYK